MSGTLTPDELTAVCRKWQERLGLQAWEVVVHIARAHEMEDNARAQIATIHEYRQADIKVLDPQDFHSGLPFPQDMEHSVVHELLHIPTAWWYVKDNNVEAGIKEQFLTDIARALVTLEREKGGKA